MGRPKYFTPNEVSVHNTADDLWVSFLGKVYNLTPLCEKYKGKPVKSYIA
jgi:cytochrome b involved in lipid metabolism